MLNLEQVGVHDDFFELGGHSLQVAQIASRVRRVLRVKLRVRDVFDAPTVASLAIVVSKLNRIALDLPLNTRESTNTGGFPLSYGQQRLWFLDQLQPNNVAYVLPSVVDLHGWLDPVALDHALSDVVKRHEVLRTVFAMHENSVEQVIEPAISETVARRRPLRPRSSPAQTSPSCHRTT